MKGRSQAVAAQPEQPQRDRDRVYLTLEEAADLARFDTCQKPVVAFRKWAMRAGLPVCRRGRVLLVERRVLEAFLNGDSWTRRHRPVLVHGRQSRG